MIDLVQISHQPVQALFDFTYRTFLHALQQTLNRRPRLREVPSRLLILFPQSIPLFQRRLIIPQRLIHIRLLAPRIQKTLF